MSVIQLAWRAEMGRRRWPPRPEPAPDEPMRDYLARLRKTAWARVDGEEAWPYGAEVIEGAEPYGAGREILPVAEGDGEGDRLQGGGGATLPPKAETAEQDEEGKEP